MTTTYLTGGEPFLLPGGKRGALLVHGFTGLPRDMRPVGEALQQAGFTALGVRLAGHATEVDDLLRNHWQDWYQTVLDGYHLLRGLCDDVVVIGLSMGAVLALRLAAEEPVLGVVTMSAPSILHFNQLDWRAHYARLISPFLKAVPKSYDGEPPTDVYTVFPTLAIAQFFDLIKATDPLLPKIAVPSLLIHSRGDDFIKPDNANYYNLRLASSPHDLFWLERSEHVITTSVEQDVLMPRVVDFVSGVG